MIHIKKYNPWVFYIKSSYNEYENLSINKIINGNSNFELKFKIKLLEINSGTIFCLLPTYMGLDIYENRLIFTIRFANNISKFYELPFNIKDEIDIDFKLVHSANKFLKIFINNFEELNVDLTDIGMSADENGYMIFGANKYLDITQDEENSNSIELELHELKLSQNDKTIINNKFDEMIFNKLVDKNSFLKIEKGEPWIMWPNRLANNFIDYPANWIFEYNGNYEFHLTFELMENIKNKSTLFSKLPTYLGFDLETFGSTFIYFDNDKMQYAHADYNWEVGIVYKFLIKKVNNNIKIYLSNYKLKDYLLYDIILNNSIVIDKESHIIFGAGNFPKNNFNLNYLPFILYELKIIKDNEIICNHKFEKFIFNKSFDLTGNCNFIHKIL